jgi:hypothetical protein
MLTRRGELIFILVALVFWIAVVGVLWVALSNSIEKQQTTSGFWVFLTMGVVGILMIVITAWLSLLAIAEAEAVSRRADRIEVSYLHFGKRSLGPAARIRKIPVRLFRFNLERGFEPAWLLCLGHWRLAVLPRQRYVES